MIPQRRENGWWKGPAAYNVFGFSPGIAVHFGIDLCRGRKVPVGIVYVASLYGHSIDEYLSADAVVRDPVLGKTADAEKLAFRVGGTKECKKMNAERIAYMRRYLKESIKRNAANQTVLNPEFPRIPKWAESKTSLLFNGAIHPLLPLTVKGVVFNDPGAPKPFDSKNYARKLELLVKSFRKWFGNPDLPVFIIQAKSNHNQNTIYHATQYAAQQVLAQKDPDVEIVVTNDIELFPKTDDVLLKTIPAIGERVYNLARRKVYGEGNLNNETPRVTGVKRELGKIVVTFSIPLRTFDGLPPDGFAVKAKGAKAYRPAKAVLKGDMIILSAPGVSNPEHANYCYLNRAIKKTPNVIGVNKMPVPAFSTELLKQGGGE